MRSGLEGGLDSLVTSAISKTLPFRLLLPEAVDAPIKIKICHTLRVTKSLFSGNIDELKTEK